MDLYDVSEVHIASKFRRPKYGSPLSLKIYLPDLLRMDYVPFYLLLLKKSIIIKYCHVFG
jgi:hypothetical protein